MFHWIKQRRVGITQSNFWQMTWSMYAPLGSKKFKVTLKSRVCQHDIPHKSAGLTAPATPLNVIILIRLWLFYTFALMFYCDWLNFFFGIIITVIVSMRNFNKTTKLRSIDQRFINFNFSIKPRIGFYINIFFIVANKVFACGKGIFTE
jgi:hypothetical protein